MNDLAHKSMGIAGVVVKDADQGIVEAVIGRTETKDLERDIFLAGAFGTRDVRVSSYNHRSWPHRGGLPPVGRGTILERGSDVVAQLKFFMSTSDGREAFDVVKEMGDLQEWSFGWLPGTEKLAELTPELKAIGVKRAFQSIPVVEVSPVLMAASIGTHTVAVKSCESCGAAIKLSQNDQRQELTRLLTDIEEPGSDGHLWVEDVIDDAVIYEVRNEAGEVMLFRRSFVVDDEDQTSIGDERIEVRRVTEFVPVEDGERGASGAELKAAIEHEMARYKAIQAEVQTA